MNERMSHLIACRRPVLREPGEFYRCPDCGLMVREADETVPASFESHD